MNSPAEENWLQEVVTDSVRRELCTQIHCTTCGAREFRAGLLDQLALIGCDSEERPSPLNGQQKALYLVRSMRCLKPPLDGFQSYEWEAAARFLTFLAWTALGGDKAIPEMQRILDGSWSGEILERMIVHHRERQEADAWHRERSDPVKAAARRNEEKRQRQIRHAERLALKRDRDKAWREKNEKVVK